MTQLEKDRIIQNTVYPELVEAKDRCEILTLIRNQINGLSGCCFGNQTKSELLQEELNRYTRMVRASQRDLQRAKAMMEYWQNLPVTK